MPTFSQTQVTPGRCFVGLWNNIAISVWTARPDGVTAKAFVSCAEQLKKTHPKFSVVHVFENGVGLPTSEGRDELVVGSRNNSDTLVCAGVLLLEGGVFATMMRAFVRGIRTLLRGDLNIVVEQDVDLLSRQLVDLHLRGCGVRISPSDLAAAIGTARRLALAPEKSQTVHAYQR